MNEMTIAEQAPLTVAEVKGQIQTIQKIMADVMKKGIHYGEIPGCGPKPVLLQPGAEKIMATFHIAGKPTVSEVRDGEFVTYTVTVEGILPTGRVLGYGTGCASTREDKYMWRKAVCDEEYDAMKEDDRARIKWGKSGGQSYSNKQVRTNPADLENTVLKMALKRATISMCRNATACSDIFAQDLEEMEPEVREAVTEGADRPEPIQQPQAKGGVKSEPVEAGAPTATGLVRAISEKPNKNKPGTFRFGVQLDDEKWYNTFDKNVRQFCEDAKNAQAPVKITYRSTKWGADIVEVHEA